MLGPVAPVRGKDLLKIGELGCCLSLLAAGKTSYVCLEGDFSFFCFLFFLRDESASSKAQILVLSHS